MTEDGPKDGYGYDRNRNLDRDRERDRERIGDKRWHQPDELVNFFNRLGYYIEDNDDVQRLAADLRWAADKRKYDSDQKPHQTAMIVSGIIAIISVALTVFGQWIVAKIKG